VLHPSRTWIDLAVFTLGAAQYLSRAIKNDKARAGSALVNGPNVFRHSLCLCSGASF
jgi:hypothetical protein